MKNYILSKWRKRLTLNKKLYSTVNRFVEIFYVTKHRKLFSGHNQITKNKILSHQNQFSSKLSYAEINRG